jgi:hypothetical protein
VVDWIGHGTYEGLLPRKRPLEYLGARYPVLSRGNRRKRDPAKLRIAARVRTETTLSLKAIAARVHLGTSKGANANLHKWMRASASATPAHPSIPNEKRTGCPLRAVRRNENWTCKSLWPAENHNQSQKGLGPETQQAVPV